MTSIGKTIIVDENRHRDSHGHYLHGPHRHSVSPIHNPRISIPRVHMGNNLLL
jgi:hypothetical protein